MPTVRALEINKLNKHDGGTVQLAGALADVNDLTRPRPRNILARQFASSRRVAATHRDCDRYRRHQQQAPN
jgi:hypothetical protein